MRSPVAFALFFLLVTGAAADTIRGLSTSLVVLEPRPDLNPSLNLRAEELAAVGLPAEVVISDALRRYADSFVVALYSDLSPAPTRGERVFTGRRVLFQVLPFATRVFVRIPVVGGLAVGDAGPEPVFAAETVSPQRFPVLLVIQPINKGIPDSVLERPFFVTFKAEILNRGLVDLKIARPAGFEQEPVRILLDARPIEAGSTPLEVEAGVHQLEVVSVAFQRETASFAVSPGQTTVLEIKLAPVASYLTVDSVAGAVVYLDGERLELASGQRRQLTEGMHTIRFKIGETNVSKRIEVRKGRSYHVSLALDLLLKEE